MKRPNPHQDSRNQAPSTAWLPVLAAILVMVTGCLSAVFVLQLDEFRPKLGDIVAFRPGSQDADIWQMSIPATIVAHNGAAVGTCSLDPNVVATGGGSMVVEARQDTPSLQYQVHWSGVRTDKPGADCGASADLLISRTDLQRLANTAGGFGIGDKGILQ